MPAENLSAFIDEIALGKLTDNFLYKGGMVTVGDKADVLTLTLRHIYPALACQLFHFAFAVGKKRAIQHRKLFLREIPENIALVFSRVRALFGVVSPARLIVAYAAVMPRGNLLCADTLGNAAKLRHFHISVADRAGIRRSRVTVFRDEIFLHKFIEFFTAINDM